MQDKRNSLYANSPIWDEWRKICSKLKKHPEIFNMKLVPERVSEAYAIMKRGEKND